MRWSVIRTLNSPFIKQIERKKKQLEEKSFLLFFSSSFFFFPPKGGVVVCRNHVVNENFRAADG